MVRLIRPLGKIALILFPVMVLWAIITSVNPLRIETEVPSTPPKWIEDGRHYSTCADAMSGTIVSNYPILADPGRAARIGAGVIASQTNFGSEGIAFKPRLVQRQFPDGQYRIAWVYGQGKVTDQSAMRATAEVVYIDATTNEPLLLIKDIFAADPNYTCPEVTDTNWAFTAIALLFLGVVLTALYLLVIVLAWLIRGRRRSHRLRTQPPTPIGEL